MTTLSERLRSAATYIDLAVCGPAADEIDRLNALVAALTKERDGAHRALTTAIEALNYISGISERKKNCYPIDWREQIAVCPECQRYKDHPIQQGICDEHRKFIYRQREHDAHETKILGYRSQAMAKDALARIKEVLAK